MRKFLNFALTAIFMCSLMLSSEAAQITYNNTASPNNNESVSSASPNVTLDKIDVNEADYAAADAALIAKGQAIQKKSLLSNSILSQTLSVPLYFQNGQSWSNDIMKTAGLAIGPDGCTLTSFTMILDFLKSTAYNPGQINTMVGGYACPFQYSAAGSACDLDLTAFSSNTQTTSSATSFITGSLSVGEPVMIGMVNGASTHFVTAYGYSGSTIYIRDPWEPRDYTTLTQYTNSGWTVNRLAVYEWQ
jgi:hypothetical protein